MNDIIARAATTSLLRAATAQRIAAVAAFLLSDETAYITGEVISADGGAASVSTIRRRAAPGHLGGSGRGRRTYGR
jgi:enoyl-[acyl-carrier-protein] reductase (NADH)